MLILSLVVFALAAATLSPFGAVTALLLLPMLLATDWRRAFAGRDALSWVMLGWLTVPPATLAWSLSPGMSTAQMAMLVCLPLGWLAGLALRDRLDTLLASGLPWLLLALVGWGILQGPETFTAKPQGPFNDPNTYAAVLNLLLLPVLARYLEANLASQSPWRRTWPLALMGCTAFTAFLVSSRGASLALTIVLPFLIWPARRQPGFGRKLALLSVIAGTAYFAALHATGGLDVVQRLGHTVTGGDPSRVMLMRSAWLMIQDHPWLGTGLGSFRLLYPQYRYPDESGTGGGWVHNDYLQFWLEAGLPMLLLLLGLVAWVGREVWLTGRRGGDENLVRMGYLAGIGVILLQAMVNFLLYFALVSLLVGLYLARLSRPQGQTSSPGISRSTPRAVRMGVAGYALILGWLLVGQVAVEVMLGQSHRVHRGLMSLGVVYPKYEAAYWLSVLAPFHPTPQHVMGLDMKDAYLMLGKQLKGLRNEALSRMEAGWQRAPCYMPYANDALFFILGEAKDPGLEARGNAILDRSLTCNPRHGLSYYHAGLLAERSGDDNAAMQWWRAGLAASLTLAERLLLASAILSRTMPAHRQVLTEQAGQMASAIRILEANPNQKADQAFWTAAQYQLWRVTQGRISILTPASSQSSR